MADPADDEPKGLRAQLETALAEAKAARVEAENASRELAFTKAGLTGLSDKQVKALVATHEGEMSADALKATATELGFVTVQPETSTPAPAAPAPTATPAPAPTVTDGDVETARELAALANFSGGSTPASEGVPATDDVLDQFATKEATMAFLRANVGSMVIE